MASKGGAICGSGVDAVGSSSPKEKVQELPKKIKSGSAYGYPVVVAEGKAEHQAILLNYDGDDPRGFIAGRNYVDVRWMDGARYNRLVSTNSVRLREWEESGSGHNTRVAARRKSPGCVATASSGRSPLAPSDEDSSSDEDSLEERPFRFKLGSRSTIHHVSKRDLRTAMKQGVGALCPLSDEVAYHVNKRQAERIKYLEQKLEDECKRRERELKDQSERHEKEIDEPRVKVIELRTQLRYEEERCSMLEESNRSKGEQLQAAQEAKKRELVEAKDQYVALRKSSHIDIQLLNEDKRSLEADLEKSKVAYEQLLANYERVAEVHRRAEALQQENNTAKDKLDESERRFKELSSTHDQLQESSNAMQRQADEAKSAHDQLLSDHASLKSKTETLQQSVQSNEDKLQESEHRFRELTSTHDKLVVASERAAEKRNSARSRAEALEQDNRVMKEEFNELERKFKELSSTHDLLRQKYTALEESSETLQRQVDEAKSIHDKLLSEHATLQSKAEALEQSVQSKEEGNRTMRLKLAEFERLQADAHQFKIEAGQKMKSLEDRNASLKNESEEKLQLVYKEKASAEDAVESLTINNSFLEGKVRSLEMGRETIKMYKKDVAQNISKILELSADNKTLAKDRDNLNEHTSELVARIKLLENELKIARAAAQTNGNIDLSSDSEDGVSKTEADEPKAGGETKASADSTTGAARLSDANTGAKLSSSRNASIDDLGTNKNESSNSQQTSDSIVRCEKPNASKSHEADDEGQKDSIINSSNLIDNTTATMASKGGIDGPSLGTASFGKDLAVTTGASNPSSQKTGKEHVTHKLRRTSQADESAALANEAKVVDMNKENIENKCTSSASPSAELNQDLQSKSVSGEDLDAMQGGEACKGGNLTQQVSSAGATCKPQLSTHNADVGSREISSGEVMSEHFPLPRELAEVAVSNATAVTVGANTSGLFEATTGAAFERNRGQTRKTGQSGGFAVTARPDITLQEERRRRKRKSTDEGDQGLDHPGRLSMKARTSGASMQRELREKKPTVEGAQTRKAEANKTAATSKPKLATTEAGDQPLSTRTPGEVEMYAVGWKFKKYFSDPFPKGWYHGEVIEIVRLGARNANAKTYRKCRYSDGSDEDYTLFQMKKWCKNGQMKAV